MKELAYDEYELVLLKPWSGSNIGDIVRVSAGMYDTLLNLKKAVRVEYYEDNISDRQKLVITIKNLEKEIKELEKENEKQRYQIEDMREEIEDLNESNKPPTKKVKKVKKAKRKTSKVLSK